MKKTIAKNASVLMASQLITWSLALLLTIILPRYLGVAGIGKLVLANSLWAIGSVFISFGMGILITKEIARKAEATAELFSTTIVVRTFLYVIAFVAIIIFAKVVDYPSDTILIVYIVGISVLFGQYAGAGRASLAGLERMEFIALADIVGKAVNVAVSIALVLLGFDIMAIAAVSIVTALVTMFIQLFP
ncbi:MAG: oligosaccharide flippase family protein [Chloroflexi bacterium]|nr:oligosaccharide flippase family protein [Chloroflexota bacterium]